MAKVTAHGLTRGLMHTAQGGKFGAGFASGFVSSGFAVGKDTFESLKGAAVAARTAVMAVVGGVTSQFTGGKFANGAITGAFVHLFNNENILKKLSFAQAREHYIENLGKELSVEASSLDLSKVKLPSSIKVGDKYPIQLFFHGDEYSSLNDALTYGGLTLVYAGDSQVAIMPDYYNFEMHECNSMNNLVRNLGTIGGRILNMDPLGSASGYTINFVGTTSVGGFK